MKAFTNVTATSVPDAVAALRRARQSGQTSSVAGGGSDLLGLMKERLITPDVVVRLSAMKDMAQVRSGRSGVTVGGQITLKTLSEHTDIRRGYAALAQAAASVATPQIRNVGTLAGNINQRPWCWYYRNGFKCFKNGGNTCFSAAGENHFHAIFGGGPSFIVHPSDAAVALVAHEATFRIAGPAGERTLGASEYFTLPTVKPSSENALADDEILVSVELPPLNSRQRSVYRKVMDREAWTHAVVSVAAVLEMDGRTCRSARLVLGGVAPIPWRVPEAEKLLVGREVTPAVIEEAAAAAVTGARPLTHNAYKVPLTQATVADALRDLAEPRA
jgi:xanthine dehydrogenase YagS FAD-binding subunit